MRESRCRHRVAIVLLLACVSGAARGDEEDGPCTGFLLARDAVVYAKPSESSKQVERQEGGLIAIANPGYGGRYRGRVRISDSIRADEMGACYETDFTIENDFLRIWLQPQRLDGRRGWVRVADLQTFEFPRPEKWGGQDAGENLTRLLRAAEEAVARGSLRKLLTGALPTSEAFAALPDAVWFAALEGLLRAGWKIDRQDRSAGVITAKERRLSVPEATTCGYMKGETERFGLNVLVVPTPAGTRVSLVLSTDDDDLATQRCVTSGAIEQRLLSAIRSALGGEAPR